MTYAEKLKDPRWQRKRLEIMERDAFECSYCGSKERTLNVHHRLYLRGKDPWDYHDDNFVTLCHECHQKAEHNRSYVMARMGSKQVIDIAIGSLVDALTVRYKHLTIWGFVLCEIAHAINLQTSIFTDRNYDLTEDEAFHEIRERVSDAVFLIHEAMFNFRDSYLANTDKS